MSSAPEDRPPPPPRTEHTTHPAFDSPDANVILVSRDLVRFRMHTFTLKTTSGWFRSLFTLPQPSPSSVPETDAPEVIHLDEDSSTLEILFRMISGLPIQPLMSFDTIDALLFVSEKYDMPGPTSLVRFAVLAPPFVDQPLRLYATASRYGWTEEAKVASQRTLAMNLWEAENWEILARMDVCSALALLKLHRSRREGLRKKLDERLFIGAGLTGYCSSCKRMTDIHSWRELKYRVALEMDVRPLGDTILDVGLAEWPEARACWEVKCSCSSMRCDKTGTIQLIKECIDSLPKTT